MNLCFAEGFFHFICVLATVVLSTKCIYEYFLNENISLVEYQSFQEFGRSGYPSISMCILNPFVKEKLQKYGPGINISSYVMFLNGSLSDESLAAIDYDEVTISLNDFVNWYWIQLSNGTRLHIPLHNYVSLRGDTSKCITVDVPFIKNELLLGFGMVIKNSIFANGKRPKNYHFSKMEGLFIALHYPNQMLIASTPWLYKWKPRLKKDNYIMQFRVKSITVVNRRDQFRSPCIDDRTGYDQYVRNSIMKEQGCKPLYWKSKLDIAECYSEKLKNFTIEKTFMNLHMNKNISWPCNFIEQVDYEYLEDDDPESTAELSLNSSFVIDVRLLMKKYLEIKQIKAYTFINLVGNVGGYIGLFLGYAILNTPKLGRKLFKVAKTTIRILKSTSASSSNDALDEKDEREP